jgi:trimeric autotransporter adhesin
MKQILRTILILLTLITSNHLSAQVQGKFGNTQSALDVNAALEIESTSKGVLLPRLTTAQQNAMSAPTNGMLIYNTDSACFVLRRAGIWRSLCAANGGEAWSTLGNVGTNANTNFIGTTDAQDLVFKTAGTEGMRILSSNRYVGIGTATPVQPLDIVVNTPTADNIHLTSYGTNPSPTLRLRAAQGTGTAPTFLPLGTVIGSWINSATSGVANGFYDVTSIRSYATETHSATGVGSNLVFFTTPNASIVTTEMMRIESNGYVGIGTATPNQQLEITAAMRMPATTTSTTGVIYKGANRFIHDYKPSANDGNNTFIGVNAGNFTMASATSWLASANTGVGSSVLTALVDGGFNTAIGRNALTATTSGSYNVGLGSFALAANVSGTSNTAIGHNALTATTTSNNTAVGGSVLASNVAGYSNTSMGESSMNKNTSGYQNTVIGQAALRENLTGNNNVGVGGSALLANTTGSNNIAIGSSALVAALTSDGNTAIGHSAMSSTTSASNVAIGYLAGAGTTSGGSNTFVGYQTGTTNTTGANNTLLGYQANVSSAALTNATAIGNGATVNASNKIRLGNTAVTNVETYGSFTTISDKRLKTNINDNFIGLNFIKAVRPVQYELKTQKGIVYDGFVAQEIDSILQKQGIKSFSGLSKPENTEGGYYTVSYATFVVPLVNAVKELDALSEQLKVKSDKLAADNAALKMELERMKKENGVLKASVDKNSQDIEAIKAALVKKQN